MASLGTKRAAQVCNKQLPSCGYCTNRDLVCRYVDSPASKSGDVMEGSVSTLLSREPAQGGNQQAIWHNCPGLRAFSMQMNMLFEPSLPTGSVTLDDMLELQVYRILNSTGLSIHEMSERYFRDFHRWLPVVSPRLLHETVVKAQCSRRPPDFSVLLLAMCLITVRPPVNPSEHSAYPEDLYVTIKMLFVQVQAVMCVSVTLIQAGLLISAYEYACGRPDAAYISMGTCIRMAYTIGLDKENQVHDKLQHETKSGHRTFEERNVWWGIVVLERIILQEVAYRNRQPTTEYPYQDSHLPSELESTQQSISHLFDTKHSDIPKLSPIYTSNVSSFGRQAQAVHLLDQVLSIINLQAGEDARIRELRRLDGELQTFLSLVMSEDGQVWGFHCGAIATALRSLFLLHEDILKQSTTNSAITCGGLQLEQSSRAALDTFARVVVDAAHDHVVNVTNVDALPLCCAYNLRIARKHIEERRSQVGGEDLFRGLESLLALETTFNKRWMPTCM